MAIRSEAAAPPVVDRPTTVEITGTVQSIVPSGGGLRLHLADAELDRRSGRLANGAAIRLRLHRKGLGGQGDIRPGARVRVLAVIRPPPGPVLPGGFDFARQASFQGISATGFVIGTPSTLNPGENTRSWWHPVEELREAIGSRVTSVVSGVEGKVAAALLTGIRGGIPSEDLKAMRDSGLAHLLAISGLHIGLVAGVVFGAVRLLVALCPPLTLRVDGKRGAALAALAFAFAYLLLSGATVPTQRAFLMTAVVLGGVLLGRDAISMRLVAAAAAVILLLRPETLFSVSFQLSFSAVIALVAVYETIGRLDDGPGDRTAWDRRIRVYFVSLLITSLVATIATTPLALYHFNRGAVWGAVSNLLAVPVTAFWVMPAGVLTLVAYPFGLDTLPARLMGEGISVVLWIARSVSSWPYSVIMIPSPSDRVMMVVAGAGLWLCLWRTKWRLWAIGAIPVVILLAGFDWRDRPRLLISDRHSLVGVVMDDGVLAVAGHRKAEFVAKAWARALGQESPVRWRTAAEQRDDVACDATGCLLHVADRRIAVLDRPTDRLEDCNRSDLVIVRFPVRSGCPSGVPLLDATAARRTGPMAFRLGSPDSSIGTFLEGIPQSKRVLY